MNLSGIDHVAIGVPDVNRAVEWYIDVLGLELQHAAEWNGVPTVVGKGTTGIAFFAREKKGTHGAGGAMLHLAFGTLSRRLRQGGGGINGARNPVPFRGSRDLALDLFP